MAHYISPTEGSIVAPGAAGYLAGVVNEAVAAGDVAVLGQDGLFYKARGTDTAVVNGAAAAMTAVFTELELSASGGAVNAVFGNALAQDPVTGALYTLTDAVRLQRIQAVTGAADINLALNLALGGTWSWGKIIFLSNGNLAVFVQVGGGTLFYGIYTPDLAPVRAFAAHTQSSPGSVATAIDAIPLAGGGFALVYQQASATANINLAVFDNAGALVGSITPVMTLAGTYTNPSNIRLNQLSNGNLLIVVSSGNTTTDTGCYMVIVTTAGVSVLARTTVFSSSGGHYQSVAVAPGFFAIARQTSVDGFIAVFSNAGAQQGANVSIGTGNAQVSRKSVKILWDGTNFVSVALTAGASLRLDAVTAAGVAVVANVLVALSGAANSVEAFSEGGLLTIAYQLSAGGAAVGLVNAYATAPAFLFTPQALTNSGNEPGILPVGDFSFAFKCAGASSNIIGLLKSRRTSILGVFLAAVARGSVAPCVTAAGSFVISALKGTQGRPFNFGGTTPIGNQGALFRNGIVQKGI